ncbi:MAG TPA: hypothetical protein VH092_37860 [Urbifossiella sp.]|nr:hypothetical protein [Urbifossiella sp.]
MLRLPAALAGCLAVALVAAADPPPLRPLPRPSERAFRTDPKAKPAPAEFAGVWVADQPSPNGDTVRRHAIHVLDADTAVWTIAQHSAGVRASTTLRGRYEVAGGEFRLHVAERYGGDEKLPARPEDAKAPRVYRFAWDGPQKAGFTLTAPDAPADSPWGKTVFRKGAAAPPAADPLTPKALLTVDRTLKKEPRYTSAPLYLLLAFGPDSADRVWAVLDDVVLYLDRNGNGDLTEEGERFFPHVYPGEQANRRAQVFQVAELAPPGGKHADFFMSVVRLQTGGVYAKIAVRVNGKTLQHAGPTDLRMTETPAEARVLPFGSRVVTAQASHTMPAVPEVGKAVDFRVRVGTPGVGPGSFVGYGSEDQPAGPSPVAEFEFAPARPGDQARRVIVPLTERCCGDQFYAAVIAPEGIRTGVDMAGLTLTFPNCPWGPVAPTTARLDVMPKDR